MQMPGKLKVISVCVILALATIAAFEPLRHNGFVSFDDNIYITENPQVQRGLTFESVIWAFATPHGDTGFWHPLTSLSHLLDYELFALNPLGHHLTSLLFHIANTLLLFWVLKRMTGAVWRSAFVAAAFALHPLHVEPVAWISERKDVLSGFFWMLTIAAYIRYAERPGIGRYLLVFAALCMGLMAKAIVVTLPFVLLLLDYWPLERFRWGRQSDAGGKKTSVGRLVLEKLPLLIPVAITSVIIFIVQRNLGAMAPLENLPINFRLSNALVSYIRYIGRMIYPSGLAVLYPVGTISLWQAAAAAVLLIAVSGLVILWSGNHKYLPVGWFWYLGSLVPVSGLIQVGSQAMADRYTYLSLVGIFIIVAWGIAELSAKWRYQKTVLSAAAILVFAVLLLCTRRQVGIWQNDFTLFGHTIEVTADNPNALLYNNLGSAFQSRGRLDEAINCYRRALQINPEYFSAHNNLGLALQSQGRLDEAVSHWLYALKLKPDFAPAHNNLGQALQSQGRFDEAVSHYLLSLKFNPNNPEAYNNLGIILQSQGRFDEAIKYYRQSLRIRPSYAPAHNNLGLVFQSQGRLDEAIACYQHALNIEPNYPDALNNLGLVRQFQGGLDEAVGYYRRALELAPDHPYAHRNIALAYLEQGKLSSAVEHFNQALRVKPEWPDIYDQLARLWAVRQEPGFHDPEKAVRLAERACELTGSKSPEILDTLAVAYAAAGRFSQAIETAEKAMELAEVAGKKDLTEKIQNRLLLYKAGQPYYGK
jgi:tetratricopeptide (TPR) repeat protein